MRIIRTSQQYIEQERKRKDAFAETLICPECKNVRSMINIPLVVNTPTAKAYQTTCENCGCIWESSEF